MQRVIGRATLSVTAIAVALGMMGGGAAANAATPNGPGSDVVITGDLDQLSAAEISLFRSDATKFVEVDPSSGDITSVTALTSAELSELRTENAPQAKGGVGTQAVSNYCNNSSLGCWYGLSPSIPLQFTVGTTSGTWSGRQNFYTGNYFAKLCWIDPLQSFPGGPQVTYCMPERNGKQAWINLGQVVTGKQVNLSTVR